MPRRGRERGVLGRRNSVRQGLGCERAGPYPATLSSPTSSGPRPAGFTAGPSASYRLISRGRSQATIQAEQAGETDKEALGQRPEAGGRGVVGSGLQFGDGENALGPQNNWP